MPTGDRTQIISGTITFSIDGTSVGFTDGGASIRHEMTFFDVMADQYLGVVDKRMSEERMFVEITMLEATGDRLALAFNQPAANTISGTQYDLGNNVSNVPEHTITIVAPGPTLSGTAVNRTFNFYRAIAIETEPYNAGQRDDVARVSVTFECVKDENNGDKFGYYLDAN